MPRDGHAAGLTRTEECLRSVTQLWASLEQGKVGKRESVRIKYTVGVQFIVQTPEPVGEVEVSSQSSCLEGTFPGAWRGQDLPGGSHGLAAGSRQIPAAIDRGRSTEGPEGIQAKRAPPSTCNVVPVTKLAVRSHSTASLMSSFRPTLPTRLCSADCAMRSCLACGLMPS